MSKRAEEAASKAYPLDKPHLICKDCQRILQEVYQEGYEQAEKDLELTWEDVKRIVAIADMMMPNTAWDKIAFEAEFQTEEMFYKEVLKRYKHGKQ